jgi:hypothetical protein
VITAMLAWASAAWAGPEAAELPEVLSNRQDLLLWVRADALQGAQDGQPVVRWPDAGPAGNHLEQVNPLRAPIYVAQNPGFADKPTLRFDGQDDLLITADSRLPVLAQGHTIFIVAQAAKQTPGHNDGLLSYVRYEGTDTPVEVAVYYSNHEGAAYRRHPRMRYPGVDTLNGPAAFQLDESCLITQRRTGEGQADLFLNGSLAIEPQASKPFDNEAHRLRGFRVGRHTSSGQFLKGDVAEIIVVNRTLNDEQRAEVERHLLGKYGISQ